jgi:hypothetical protein
VPIGAGLDAVATTKNSHSRIDSNPGHLPRNSVLILTALPLLIARKIFAKYQYQPRITLTGQPINRYFQCSGMNSGGGGGESVKFILYLEREKITELYAGLSCFHVKCIIVIIFQIFKSQRIIIFVFIVILPNL